MNKNLVIPDDLVHKKESSYFALVLIISIIIYISLIFSIFGILFLLGLMLFSMFINGLMIANIRTNGVKLSSAQFPEVYLKVEELCRKMDMETVPDIYVIQSEGLLNAFATRFFGRNMVVLYSEIFDLISTNNESELEFVIAHELAHIKRNHLTKHMLILPAMWIPGLAELYIRACEYTCDRYAAYYTENSEAAKNGLTMLAIGKNLYLQVNKEEYIKQLIHEKGFFILLSELLSTHPPLPKRINEVAQFFEGSNQSITLPSNKRGIILGILIICSATILSVALFVMVIYFMVNDSLTYDPVEDYVEEDYIEEEYEEIITPPLISAVAQGEINQVKAYIEAGQDLYIEDYYGNTALDWAVKSGNIEMAELLLSAGMDPNYESSYGRTPLMTAAEIGDAVMVFTLIEWGGKPNYQVYSGMTALTYAIYSSDIETVKLLLDFGADPNLKDYQDMDAYMTAIEMNEREIAELIKSYQ